MSHNNISEIIITSNIKITVSKKANSILTRALMIGLERAKK